MAPIAIVGGLCPILKLAIDKKFDSHISVLFMLLNIEQRTNDACKLTCYKLFQESLSHSTPVQPLFHLPPSHDGGLLSHRSS